MYSLRDHPKVMRWLMLGIAAVLAAAMITGIILLARTVPEATLYVPIVAIGLALALQKFTASIIAYFVIVISGTYGIGDRIRIGSIKGDVQSIGLVHSVLEEVGEDEKLGGELTGRILHVPNNIVLDQPVLNYSKKYSVHRRTITSDFLFDEVRIPITTDSDVEKAGRILEHVIKTLDEGFLQEAGKMFRNGYPRFLDEARHGPRVLVHVEPERIWIKGKFVAPLRGRNDLKTKILLQFIREISETQGVKLA